MNEKELVSSVTAMAAIEIIVCDAQSYDRAGQLLREIKGNMKRVVDFFNDPKKKAHETWKAICGKEGEMLAPLKSAESCIKKRMVAYCDAETKRIEAENAKRESKSAKLVELAAEAELAGEHDIAAEAIAEAIVEAAPVAAPASSSGVSTRKVWRVKVTDKAKIPLEYMIVNEKALEAFAKATGGSVEIPGVAFYTETVIAARSK